MIPLFFLSRSLVSSLRGHVSCECVRVKGFSWAIVSRESSSNEANSIGKTDMFYSDWRVGQGGAGGALSTVQSYSGSTGFCAAATYSQSDLQHFQVWVGTLAAGSGTTNRPLTGYIDGSAAGWQNRWSGCGAVIQGSVSSTYPVTIGSSLYNGDIMEVIVWKGVALRCEGAIGCSYEDSLLDVLRFGVVL
jgi:hypothetical protein